MIAPVLGIAPEAALTALLIASLLGWAASRGLLIIWVSTFGAVLLRLAQLLNLHIRGPFGFHINIDAGGWASDLNNTAVNFLSAWVRGSEQMMGDTWYAMTWVFTAMSGAISWTAQEVLDGGHWMIHTFVPAFVQTYVGPIERAVAIGQAATHRTTTVVKVIERTVVEKADQAARTHVPTVAIPFVGSWYWIHRHIHVLERLVTDAPAIERAIAVPFPLDLPIPFGLTIRQIKARLRRLEGLFGVTAFAGMMAMTLGIPSWRCLTKGPLGRTSRALCGLDSDLLNLLLLGVSEAFVVTDLCDFAHLLTDATEQIVPGLMDFVGVEDALIGCHGATAPPAFKLAPLDLPQLIEPIAIAA